jgi:endonuclease YncB( thermonuclease family)
MDLMRFAGLLALSSLVACGGSDSLEPGLFCAPSSSGRLLQGVVSEVQDGDTLTVGASRIRLSAIDAPELSQDFGLQSRAALRALVLGRPVSIAYSDTDRYGRLLGQVFVDGCVDVNLHMVKTGAAWFYRAYQCDVLAVQRAALEQAESHARLAHEGLWANPAPVSPWVFRNGTDPEVPVCAGA